MGSCQDSLRNARGSRRGSRARPWYRQRKQARERQALTLVAAAREAVFDRLGWQLARLQRELETVARFTDEAAEIIAELAAMTSGAGCR